MSVAEVAGFRQSKVQPEAQAMKKPVERSARISGRPVESQQLGVTERLKIRKEKTHDGTQVMLVWMCIIQVRSGSAGPGRH